MPQASDELRKLVRAIVPGPHYGSIVDRGDAETWLKNKGWVSDAEEMGVMYSPDELENLSDEEFYVMAYLVEEWDYAYDGVIVHA